MGIAVETLTVILKGDGSGLSATLRTANGEVRQFGGTLDVTSGKVRQTGDSSRKAAKDVDALGESTQRSAGRLREWAGGLNTLRGTLATLGFTLVAREMLGAGLAMDRLERSTAAAIGSQSLAGRELAFVRSEAQRLGIYFPTLAEGYAGLLAATRGTNLEGGKTRLIFLGIAEAGRAMNLSQERMQGILNATQQIAGKGTVSMEELRQQLGDRLPGAMQIAARAMDMTVAELVKMVSEGKLLSEDFLPKFAAELRDSAAAGVELARNSPAATFERLRTALFDLGVAAARGGVLEQLASGARILTTVLNALVSSGAIGFITQGLVTLASVGAVFYVGGLLQRGFVALATSVALTRAPVTAFNVGLAASSVGAQGLTVRMAAASVGARGLAAAMAFISANPIGLAVTALTALYFWVERNRSAAVEMATELKASIEKAANALQEFNKAPSLEAVFTIDEAKVGKTIDGIREHLERLREERDRLQAQQGNGLDWLNAGRTTEELSSVSSAIVVYEKQIQSLGAAQSQATATTAAMLQELIGVKEVTPATRAELATLAAQMLDGRATNEAAATTLARLATEEGNAGAAAWIMANGMEGAKQAVASLGDIVEDARKRIANLNIQMAGLKGGTEGEIKQRYGQQINAAGGPQALSRSQMAEIGRTMNEEIRLAKQVEGAQKAQSDARKANTAAVRAHRAEQRQQIKDDNSEERALRSLNDLIRKQQDEYGGPMVKAANAYKDALSDIQKVEDDLRKAHRLDAGATAQLTAARNEAANANERNVEMARREESALERRGDLVSEAGRAYDDETYALADNAREHDVREAILRAEAAAQELYNKGLRTTPDLLEKEAAGIRSVVESGYEQRKVAELAREFSNDFANVWGEAIDSVADAFGDWVASGFRDTESLLDSLKQTFQRWLADIVSMFARQQLGRVIGNWAGALAGNGSGGGTGFWGQALGIVSNYFGGGSGGGGGGSGATGFWGQAAGMAAKYFGGGSGGFASAGGGMMSSAMSGYANGGMTGAWQGVLSSLGMGGGAAATGAWGAGLGSAAALSGSSTAAAASAYGAFAPNVAGFTAAGGAGAGTAGAAAGGASGGATAAASAAWVLAILAGMYQGAQWFKQGWKMQGSEMGKYRYATPANTVATRNDDILQAFGVSPKWAAILSGSSGVARGFGLQAPKVQGYGFTGQVGFDGMEGSNLAFIKRKGGWFRSDKKYTEDFELSAGIDRAFDSIAMSIGGRAKGLAEQIGIDITSALGSYTLDLGKIKLDKDPEKAKQQIADKISEVTNSMLDAAVRALGFEHLMDDGFEAQEVMTALAASIQLVTGTAQELGRSLTEFEIGNITKAVEYFEGLALKNGSEMSAEIERVVGLLGSYTDLVSQADTQLKMSGLNDYQQGQLQVELQYRSQVKSLNDMAKALGLTGARAEDLAKLEMVRAQNMASLQTQMEAQRDSFLSDLGLSELSPLRDDQKLAESMQLLRDAVTGGDMAGAQQYAETALGFGRNLYASGQDYNALYGEVTGLVGGMSVAASQGLANDTLREMADAIIALPDALGRVIFSMAAGISLTPPPVVTTPPASTGGATDPSGGVLGPKLDQTNRLLERLLTNSDKSLSGEGMRDLKLGRASTQALA